MRAACAASCRCSGGRWKRTLAATVFADQVKKALKDPASINYWVLAGVVVFFVVASLVVRRWLGRLQRQASR